jgi:hypothetical protein
MGAGSEQAYIQGMFKVSSYIRSLMRGTEIIPEILFFFYHLM